MHTHVVCKMVPSAVAVCLCARVLSYRCGLSQLDLQVLHHLCKQHSLLGVILTSCTLSSRCRMRRGQRVTCLMVMARM